MPKVKNIFIAFALTLIPTQAFASICDQIIDKKYFKICFSYKFGGPLFVKYQLDGKKVNSINIKKRPRFYEETQLPRKYRTKYSNYTRNKFKADRGHLAPDASFDWSADSLNATYSMANIIPQYKWINRKTWIKAENRERELAQIYKKVTVLNGVVYDKNLGTIGRSKQRIPSAFWKEISWRGGKECYYYINKKITKREYQMDRLEQHKADCSSLYH